MWPYLSNEPFNIWNFARHIMIWDIILTAYEVRKLVVATKELIYCNFTCQIMKKTWIIFKTLVFFWQPEFQFSFMLISDNKCKISQINKPTYMLVRGILVCLVSGGLVLNNTSPGHSKVILVRVLFFVNKRAEVNHLRLWGALYSHKVLQVAITRHTIVKYEQKNIVYKYYSFLFWNNFSEF